MLCLSELADCISCRYDTLTIGMGSKTTFLRLCKKVYVKVMEQSLSTLLKKHCELMDYCLKDDSSMQLIQERVKMKKPLDSLLWLEIQRLIVGMEPAFLRRLKKVAPDLTEKERQLCCLLRLHVPVDYIAVLLQLSKSSVAVYKSDILKKRFEMQGTPLSLLLFLL